MPERITVTLTRTQVEGALMALGEALYGSAAHWQPHHDEERNWSGRAWSDGAQSAGEVLFAVLKNC